MQATNVSYNVVIEVGRVVKLLGVTTYQVHCSCWLGCMCSRLGICHWLRIQLGSMLLGSCGWSTFPTNTENVSDKWFRFGPWVFVERASRLPLPPIGLVVFYRLMMSWLTSLYSIFRWTTLSVSRNTCPSGPIITTISLSVGQVTPTMLKHLRFGTFIFFGVCQICISNLFSELIVLNRCSLFLVVSLSYSLWVLFCWSSIGI